MSVAKIHSPTWSPDSGALAFATGSGVIVGDIEVSGPCKHTRLLAAGASSPDWGPANVNLAERPHPAAGAPGSSAAGTTAKPPLAANPGARITRLWIGHRMVRSSAELRFRLNIAAPVTVTIRSACCTRTLTRHVRGMPGRTACVSLSGISIPVATWPRSRSLPVAPRSRFV